MKCDNMEAYGERDILISVVIPTYNRRDTLLRSVASVLNQTYKNLEVVIIDDASTDDTETLIKNLNDSRIVYFKNPIRLGGAGARNVGISISQGEYVAFQDSDDEWLANKLEEQVKVIKRNGRDADVVFTAFTAYGKTTAYIPDKDIDRVKMNQDILNTLFEQNVVSTQTILARRECLEDVGGFDEEMPRLQDWELALRLAEKYKFKFIDKSLVNVHFSPVSISTNHMAYIKAKLKLLIKYRSAFIKNKKVTKHMCDMILYGLEHGIMEGLYDLVQNHFDDQFQSYYLEACHMAFKKRDRLRMENNLLYKWMDRLLNHETILEYLKSKGYKSIGIYGMGNLGIRLYHEIKDGDVEIKYMIDKSVASFPCPCPIIDVDHITQDVDAIIITPIYYYEEIKNTLSERVDCKIISLEEVIHAGKQNKE